MVAGGFDEREVYAAVVHLAAKGLIRFHGLDNYYALSRTGLDVPPDLPPNEIALFRKMFNIDSGGSQPFAGRLRTYEELPHDAFLLPPIQDPSFAALARTVQGALNEFTSRDYFTDNLGILIPPAILASSILFYFAQDSGGGIFVGLLITLVSVFPKPPSELTSTRTRTNQVMLMVVRIFFALICATVISPLMDNSASFLVSLVAIVCELVCLQPLLRTPTPLGRDLLDQIAGYRKFLEEVELDRMLRMKSPSWVPTPSTEYLAYAMAFDMGNAWENFQEQSGYWIVAWKRDKTGVQSRLVKVKNPYSDLDDWLGFALAMVAVSAISTLLGVMATPASTNSANISSQTLATGFGLAFLVLSALLFFRSR